MSDEQSKEGSTDIYKSNNAPQNPNISPLAPRSSAPALAPAPIASAPQQNMYMQPAEQPHAASFHSFLYLVSFFALGWLATGVGCILYQLVNKYFSDSVTGGYYGLYSSTLSQFALKYGMATLIIAGPIYFVMVYWIAKFMSQGKISPVSKVRSWITYIILFLVSATVIGDLIVLVFQWLGGGLIIRSLLKSAIVVFISGFIFAYYFWDMRNSQSASRKKINRIFFWSAVAVTFGTVLIGFSVMQSPTATRQSQEDSKTISALQNAKYNVEYYYQTKYVLPSALTDAQRTGTGSVTYVTADNITYSVEGEKDYKLCADFKRATEDDKKHQDPYYVREASTEWNHPKGNHCFTLSVKDVRTYAPTSTMYTSPAPGNSWGTTTPVSPIAVTSTDPVKIKEMRAMVETSHATAMSCINDGGTLQSGQSGAYLCTKENGLRWPDITALCGAAMMTTPNWYVISSSTTDTTKWSYSVTCMNVSECSGEQNIVCTSEGCISVSGKCLK